MFLDVESYVAMLVKHKGMSLGWTTNQTKRIEMLSKNHPSDDDEEDRCLTVSTRLFLLIFLTMVSLRPNDLGHTGFAHGFCSRFISRFSLHDLFLGKFKQIATCSGHTMSRSSKCDWHDDKGVLNRTK